MDPTPRTTSPHYALLVLTTIYGVSLLDRNIVALLLDSIKAELHLTDTMLGLVSGFGFALMYSLLALPVARWADHGNRRNIIVLGALVYSAMTVLSGFAQNLLQLALARIGVGLGESTGIAASNSMIADYYPREQRSRAYSIYSAGSYVGVFFGYLIGGWINHYYGWRAAFVFAGVPGICLALLLRYTVAEPARGRFEPLTADRSLPPLGATLRFLLARRSFVLIVLAGALMSITLYSFSTWAPSVLRRVHHMSSGEIGSYAGVIKGLCGLLGALSGGFIVEKLARDNEPRKVVIAAVGCALACPPLFLFLLAQTPFWSLIGLALSAVFTPFSMGPMWAVLQSVVKLRMRAQATAIFIFCTMMLGLGVGPLAVGFMNDALAQRYGADAIRYSLLAPACACVLAGLVLLLASRRVSEDIERSAQPD